MINSTAQWVTLYGVSQRLTKLEIQSINQDLPTEWKVQQHVPPSSVITST